jgi:hypothetical protein
MHDGSCEWYEEKNAAPKGSSKEKGIAGINK